MENSNNTNDISIGVTKQLKHCLFITPISTPGSETRNLTDGIISAIRPVLKEFGYVLSASHEISTSGSINDQIINRLINDQLVIANLTHFNPNVMYELAVRHCSAKPVILIVQKGDEVPFDILQERRIEYVNDIQGGEALKEDIHSAMLELTIETHLNYNPVYKVAKLNLIEKNLKPGEDDFKDYMLSAIQTLTQKVERLTNNTIIPNNISTIDGTITYAYKILTGSSQKINPDEITDLIFNLPSVAPYKTVLTLAIAHSRSPAGSFYLTMIDHMGLNARKIRTFEMELKESGFVLQRVSPPPDPAFIQSSE